FVHNLEGDDLLSGSQETNLYTLSMGDMMTSSPLCLLSKASKTKSGLWHRRLSHLNFGAINHLARQGLVRGLPKLKFEKDHLCSACAMGKSKKQSHKPKSEDTNQEKLYLLHMDLCGPMRVASINGKKYILVIVDDYSRFTWVKFLASKDEAPDFIIKFLKMIQVRLNAPVRNIRTDNGTEFVNQTLRSYYESVGISHETSVARSPQQNGVVERRNRTLVEAARTMLIYAKAPLFLWAEAVATASLCYPNNDSEDLGKLQAKADIGIFIGYAPKKKAYRIYNRRTQKIIETIHVDFDELTAMASEQISSGPGLQFMTPATSSSGLVTNPIPQQPCNPPPRDDWDRLFQPMFDEYFNPPTINVSPVPVAAAPRAVDLANSPVSTSIDQDAPSTSIPSTQEQEHSLIISQGFEESPKMPHFHDDPLHASLHEDSASQGSSSNVRPIHTLVKSLEPKNFKQAMTEPYWIDAMQEEIHEFERLQVLELVTCLDTPMVEKNKLDEDLQGTPVDATLYCGMIGSLMYLTSSRSDLIYAVCLCARYQAKPTEKHLNALTDYGFQFNKIPLYCDNKSAIALCCNNVQHSRAKHIDVCYRFIKEHVENGIVELYFVRTEYQLADIFTKPLLRERFNFLIEKLSMKSMSPETLKHLTQEEDE
ncbi:retrovirus-related pol polyprotein from transposon TNT 1-94, partial [Tanacetum coccineum]